MIRVGLAGWGVAGQRMAAAVSRAPSVVVTARSDPDGDRLDAAVAACGARGFPSVEAMAEWDGFDVGYVATPTHLHLPHVLALATAGKHVIVEKPIAPTLEDADEMVRAGRAAGVILLLGASHSIDAPIVALRELVEREELGALRMLTNFCFTDWLARPRKVADLDTRLGGGVVMRQGSHQFDILRYLGGGLVRQVRATTAPDPAGNPTEGSYTALLEFAGGVSATAVYSGLGLFDTRLLTFGVGEEGEVSEVGANRLGRYLLEQPAPAATHAPAFGLTIASFERADVTPSPHGLLIYRDGAVEERVLESAPSAWDALVRELPVALSTGDAARNGEWALATLEVCLAVVTSAATSADVALHRQVETPTRTNHAALAALTTRRTSQ